jgi:hypothetical protein
MLRIEVVFLVEREEKSRDNNSYVSKKSRLG